MSKVVLASGYGVLNAEVEEKLTLTYLGLYPSWWGWARRDDGFLVGTRMMLKQSSTELVFRIRVYSNTTDVYQDGGCQMSLTDFVKEIPDEDEENLLEEWVDHNLSQCVLMLMKLVEGAESDQN